MARSIVVVGNCQAAVLANCLALLSPDSLVEPITAAHFPGYGSDPGRLLAKIAASDLAICQSFEAGPLGRLTHADVQAEARACVMIPNIQFGAFHPDIVYVHRGDGRGLHHSVIGDYHSALALYGHARGHSARDTAALFRDEIYEALGYHESWAPSQAALLAEAAEVGFDIAPLYAGWMRRGCFMHTVNHPKLFVFGDLAQAALARAGVPALSLDCADYLADPLMGAVWPVYRPIAARLGVAGGHTFKHASDITNAAAELAGCMGLEDFIARSFALYDARPGVAADCPRVQAWLGDGRISAALTP